MNKSHVIDYVSQMLNIEITNDLVYLDISNTIDKIIDHNGFLQDVKSIAHNANMQDKYLTGIQKFTKVAKRYLPKQETITDNQQMSIYRFSENLTKKLTWYFDELAWLNPTPEQIKNQYWQGYEKKKGENYFTDKELKVCKEIGDNTTLFRMATKNKVQLEEDIRNIVTRLVVTKKKEELQLEQARAIYNL